MLDFAVQKCLVHIMIIVMIIVYLCKDVFWGAMSTFSPVSKLSSNGFSVRVLVYGSGIVRNELIYMDMPA